MGFFKIVKFRTHLENIFDVVKNTTPIYIPINKKRIIN